MGFYQVEIDGQATKEIRGLPGNVRQPIVAERPRVPGATAGRARGQPGQTAADQAAPGRDGAPAGPG